MRDSPTLESGSRVCTLADLPWLLSLGYRRYRKPFDPGAMLTWLVRVINSPKEAIAIRTDHAGAVAILTIQPWYPDELECQTAVLVAEKGYHWDAVRLLRETILWARAKGCVRWRVWSDTENDLEMLARRVGAKPLAMKYEIELRE